MIFDASSVAIASSPRDAILKRPLRALPPVAPFPIDEALAENLLEILRHDDVEQLLVLVDAYPDLITHPLGIAIALHQGFAHGEFPYTATLSQCPFGSRSSPEPSAPAGESNPRRSGAGMPVVYTTLMLAVWHHAIHCFLFLLPQSDTSHQIKHFGNVLSMAAACEFWPAIGLLLPFCDPEDSPNPQQWGGPLLHALASCPSVSPAIFRRVIRRVDLDALDRNGYTALMCAVRFRQEPWVRLLLQYTPSEDLGGTQHPIRTLTMSLSSPRLFSLLLAHFKQTPEFLVQERALLSRIEEALRTAQCNGEEVVLANPQAVEGPSLFCGSPQDLLPTLNLLRAREERRVLQQILPSPGARLLSVEGPMALSNPLGAGRRRSP